MKPLTNQELLDEIAALTASERRHLIADRLDEAREARVRISELTAELDARTRQN